MAHSQGLGEEPNIGSGARSAGAATPRSWDLGEEPRIGTGLGWFIAAGAFFAFGVFAGLASAGGGEGAGATAAVCFGIAGGLGSIGLAVRLLGVIERRLIAIERAARRS